MRRYVHVLIAVLVLGCCSVSANAQGNAKLEELVSRFAEGYQSLRIPEFSYDYKDYFNTIPALEKLRQQELFFQEQQKALGAISGATLSLKEKIERDHLRYETAFNLERIALETDWVKEGRRLPLAGLSGMKDHERWYRFFIQRYTGLERLPEDIMSLGKAEVARVQKEIGKIREGAGFRDSATFYTYLRSDTFFLDTREEVLRAFARTDSIIRTQLGKFVGKAEIPPIFAMEWPEANANTPPGIYLNAEDNPYGRHVFQYNFYGGRYNRRAIEWLYMHEAIPGHHLQFSLRKKDGADALQYLFLYPGNFEGWGCYVEYYGKELGLYADPFSELGKWEWDLVRSARLCIDAGIHQYGWSQAKALEYWRREVPGQEQIAEREITRVTNWTAQALSYKAGADCILELRRKMEEKYGARFDEARFHRTYLSFGMRPLEVIKQNFEEAYEAGGI